MGFPAREGTSTHPPRARIIWGHAYLLWMDRIVLHLDMDAFFASCEELRHPEAAGGPLVVGASPKEGRGRGVVIAANYAARRFGLRSAMPIQEAWRRCPEALYVAPDHRHYGDTSRRIFEDLGGSFPVRQTSIDEASLEAGPYTDWTAAPEFAARIQARVAKTSGGLGCSIGVGTNRLVAKIASDHRKPRGITLVPPAETLSFLEPLAARCVPGIGPKTERRLAEQGIRTIADLRRTPIELLATQFGVHGEFMHRAARGEGDGMMGSEAERTHSMSEERTLLEDTRDRGVLVRLLRRMMTSLEQELARHRYWFRNVALKVRFSDFETHTKQASFPRPTSDTTPARRAVPRLLDAFLDDLRPVRLIGLRFGELAEPEGQRTLHDFVFPRPRTSGT